MREVHKQREDLDLIFRHVTPEFVLRNMRDDYFYNDGRTLGNKVKVSMEEMYEHFSAFNFSECSPNETKLRYREVDGMIGEDKDIFKLLYQYADKVLVADGGKPVCRLAEILNWNSISSRLGQDLFVTSWLAHEDVCNYGIERNNIDFCWSPIIGTDDKRLNNIIGEGLAENHFHHHGSTQSFSLSWVSLMNHPSFICKFFEYKKQFWHNLNTNISRGAIDNVMDWKERILYAAFIRALLFERCLGIVDSNELFKEFRIFDRLPLAGDVKGKVEMLRLCYGAKFKQSDIYGKYKCLDYAICNKKCMVCEDDNNRILSGERSFLYHCFAMDYKGQFTKLESDMLYLYLLIKSNFRSELIQVNKRPGFLNFSMYQDRKNQFFEYIPEYWGEAQRIGVCGAIMDNNIISLESRIMPKLTAKELNRAVKSLDWCTKCENINSDGSVRLSGLQDKHFYVIHFPKSEFTESEFQKLNYFEKPRNHKIRYIVEKQAKAIVNYLDVYKDARNRVKGIDACSTEIGCRPETFATVYRYIRGCTYKGIRIGGTGANKIGMTYHVGEDFLDIADGLRAIDETLRFLELEKGDRLGHALALGMDPEVFYRLKKCNVYITKQDYLDNLVWILYRSLELNISIDLNHRTIMAETARELFDEIYAKNIDVQCYGDILDLYYQSWKLRGDYPWTYTSEGFSVDYADSRYDDYSDYMLQKNLSHYRNNEVVSKLYYLYHFNKQVKLEGLKPKPVLIEAWYIKLMEQLQSAMIKEVYKKGLSIECNPTSNVLIGTFGYYEKHPILKFNNFYLEDAKDSPNIQVSINTDDLGVFDTSLSNEYALMFRAIQMKRHREGNFDDDSIYKYLDYIRGNGINMVFK